MNPIFSNKKLIGWVLGGIVTLLLITFSLTVGSNIVSQGVNDVTNILGRMLAYPANSVNDFMESISNLTNTYQENQTLKQKVETIYELEVQLNDLKKDNEKKTKAVIGVIDGDTHDIGKNLVKIMLETAGFDMIDLGKDVAVKDFIKAAIDNKVSLVCMSSLMSTTMYGMKKVIEGLAECGYRDNVKIMVGGGPVTESFAIQIGADAYSDNAIEAVNVAKRLCGLN